jgi:peptide-methionine (S)-S-oxide reductase
MSTMFRNVRKTPALVAASILAGIAAAGILSTGEMSNAAEPAVVIPAPVMDQATTGGLETAIFAGGCFWGVQGVFQHVAGVESAVSGYAGGTLANPTYRDVGSETTGHAESVKVTFDPAKVSYGTLLQVFFSVAHNPTQLNFQGPDQGPSYRSALFTMNDEQAKVAKAYIAQLDAAGVFPAKIVTEVTPYTNFYQAEDYHQDYATLHPQQPYIAFNDLPKIRNLQTTFPDVWRDQPTLVFADNPAS